MDANNFSPVVILTILNNILVKTWLVASFILQKNNFHLFLHSSLILGNLSGKIRNIFSSFSPITGYSSYSTCSGFTIQKILKWCRDKTTVRPDSGYKQH